MTLVILAILILAYILIATENITKVNRCCRSHFCWNGRMGSLYLFRYGLRDQ